MKGDLDKDGKMSGYEQARQDAIEKNMREQKSIGGIVRALSSKAKAKLRKELPKRYYSILTPEDAEFNERATTADNIIEEYEMGEDTIFYTTLDGTDSAITKVDIEEILGEAKKPTQQPVQQQTPARQRANAKQEAKKQQAKDKTADALKQRQVTSKQRQAGAKKRTKAQEKLRISDIDRIQQAARRLGLKRNVQIIHVDEEIGREAEGKFSLGSGGANAKLQNAIDDLKDRVAKGQKKYGRTIRFKNGDVIIIADNNAELKKGYYQTVMHELGESFVNQELDRSLKNSRVRNKLLEAFNKVKNKNPAYQKENGFYEWIADNFGSALRIELGLPQDLNTANLKKINKSANTWFKRLAKKLKE